MNASANKPAATAEDFAAAGNIARELAADTLAGRRPFLGVFGAADASGIADATLAKCAGYVYLYAVQEVTGERVTCDAAGFLVDVPARRFRVVRGTLPGFRVGKTWCADSARDAVRIDTAALAEPGALGAFANVEPAPVVAVYELREVPAADWR